MTCSVNFKIERFRMPSTTLEHDVDLDDILDSFGDTEAVLKTLAKDNNNFDTELFEFIDGNFVGGFDAFVEKFKESLS